MGTILASFLAASCCIGPAIFVIFGTSASFMSSFTFLEPLRPYLHGTAILLLGFSFWKLYLNNRIAVTRRILERGKLPVVYFGLVLWSSLFLHRFKAY
ncbi:MAG: mercuric transporter MerT family protein [Nitrospinales bacterium]